MSEEHQTEIDENQPEIKDQTYNSTSQNVDQAQNSEHQENRTQSNGQNRDTEQTRFQAQMKNIRLKHPECIPVFYVKHQASPKQFPSPKIPFILFKKNLLIEQAMYNLYNQIQIKGLYFFCTRYDLKDKKTKYVILKPGQTIEQIYDKYGKNDHLTLIYGDKNIGMGGVNKMEKWLIRTMVFLLTIWILIISYPLYIAYDQGGTAAVWDTLSLIWTKPNRHQDKPNQTHKNDSFSENVQNLEDVNNFSQEDMVYQDMKQDGRQQMWESRPQPSQEKVVDEF